MTNNDFSWMNNPALKNIDAAKLQILMTLANQGKGKSQKELLPFLMTAASQARSSGNSFTNDETNLILEVLKQGKSPEETAKIEQMVSLVQKMKQMR